MKHWMTWIGPIRLMSTMLRHCRWVSCSTVPQADTPAMLNTMSIAPWWAVTSAAKRATAS